MQQPVYNMLFSVHRSHDSDDGYDSLWSDSEEEEFPVNPSEDDGIYTPPEDEDSDSVKLDGSFASSINEGVESPNERRSKRRSILADYTTANSATSPHFNKQRNSSSPVLTRAQLNADLDNINELIGKWSISNMDKYRQQRKEEQAYARHQWDQIHTQEKGDIDAINQSLTSVTARRRSKIQSMLEDRRLYEELLEKERIEREEAERKSREEEERRIKEEAERKAREEAERKAREEAERKAKEEAERKAREEVERQAKEKSEREAKERSEREAKEKAERDAREKAEQEKASKAGYTDWKSVESEFKSHKDKIEDIKNNILSPVSKDPTLKKYCFEIKKQIKPKLGQLTDSKQQLKRVISDVHSALSEAKSYNQLAYSWGLNFFSKALISQSEIEVSVKTQAALPLGLLALHLLVKHQELKEFLMARFVKKCPMVIGYNSSINTEEGRIRMGWKRSSDDKWEDETMYSERMAGICAVWAVMTQSKLSPNIQHPYPISNSWRFLARQLNRDNLKETSTNTHFAVVAAWWEVAAERFSQAYGRQGIKLLKAIWDNWTDLVKEKHFPAAARLRLLGEDWVNDGVIKSLKPMSE